MRLSSIYMTLAVAILLAGGGLAGLKAQAQARGADAPDGVPIGRQIAQDTAVIDAAWGDAEPAPVPVADQPLAPPPRPDRPVEQARGLVQPSRQVMLRSPLNELLETITARESEQVQAGQVLARLDSREQVLAVEAARLEAASEAQVRQAQLAVEEAVFSLELVTDLDGRDVVGPWEVRRARLEKRQAEAGYDLAMERAEQAQLQYERQRARLARYEITAPFDGTVHRIEADKGTLLSSDQPILSVVALDPLHAVVYVPIEQYGQLEKGRLYELEAASPINQRLIGELTTVDRVLDPASRSFRCVFEIENPESLLPAGFTVVLVGRVDEG